MQLWCKKGKKRRNFFFHSKVRLFSPTIALASPYFVLIVILLKSHLPAIFLTIPTLHKMNKQQNPKRFPQNFVLFITSLIFSRLIDRHILFKQRIKYQNIPSLIFHSPLSGENGIKHPPLTNTRQHSPLVLAHLLLRSHHQDPDRTAQHTTHLA